MNFGKTLGCTFIISGTAVGAGMLALPIVSHAANFSCILILLFAVWALMVYCALLILEVTLAFKPYQNNFSSMTEEILGKKGKITIWLSSMLLLYSLTAAYISGASSLLTHVFSNTFSLHIPYWVSASLFTLLFGSLVSLGVRKVDLASRYLMSAKILILVFTMLLLVPQIHFSQLITQGSFTSKTIWGMIPIFLTSFAFHHVIPSLANYAHTEHRCLSRAIYFGTTIPLILYIFWLATILGVVSSAQFQALDQGDQTDIGRIIQVITTLSQSKWAAIGVDLFSDIALMTSFLGVTLGLFDFMADACKRPYTAKGRFQTSCITFIPPLLFALFYPSGFILALGYAAIFVAIMQIIMPALMVVKKRKRYDLISNYRAPGGLLTLISTIILGFILIILQFVISLKMLYIFN